MKRQRNFDSLKRMVRGWLCRHGRHRWSYFTKQTKTLVFYERSCQSCGLFEINSAGPIGDKKWHKPEACFTGPCGEWKRVARYGEMFAREPDGDKFRIQREITENDGNNFVRKRR